MHKPYSRNFLFPVLLSVFVLLLSTAFLSQPEQLEGGFLARLLVHSQHWNEHRGNEQVYVQTDKPFYQPGETVWLEAYLRNEEDLKPSRLSHILHVELINPKGSVEKSIQLIAQQGVASGDFSLDADAPGGIYKLKAYTQWQRNFKHTLLFEKELQVQQTVLPRLKIQLEFVRKAYGPGDRVEATLKLHSLENKPLAYHAVTYQVQLAGEEAEAESSRADAEGVVHLSFSLPQNLTTPDGLLTVLVPHEGGTESISRSIPLVLNQIGLSFYPEGGDLVAGLSGRVAFAAVNEFGKPTDITGVVEDEGGKAITYLSSYHQGMGAFTLLPKAGSKYRVRLTKPQGIRQTYSLPEALPEGYSLSTSLPQSDKLGLTLSATQAGQVALVMQVRGKVYYSRLLEAKASSTSLTIPLENVPAGVAQLTLFDGRGIARAERLVFVNKHKRLNLSVATDKEKYLPREKVKMTIRATDEKGLPVPAQLSLAVADDKLLSFADDKSGHILSKLLLEPDLWGEVEEPNFYFDPKEPKANQALDYLLITRGWRHFTWQEVLSGKLPPVDHAPEQAVVFGRVIDPFKGGAAVGATIKQVKGSRQVKTDSLGNFTFPGLDLSQPALLEVTTASYVRQLWVDDYSREYIIKGEVAGWVVADDGYPLPGVNVLWKGTTQGTITDVNGNYAIAPCQGCSTLVFSFIGFVSKEVDVSRSSQASVQLELDIQALEEVGVTGYGTTERLEGRVYGLSTEAKSSRTKNKVPKVRTTRMVPPEAVPDEELVEPGPAQQADKEVPLSWQEVAGDPNADPDIMIEEPGVASLNDSGAETVFQVVEQMPEFPGGMKAMTKFIGDSLYYSYRARRAQIQGTVYVSFLVETSGKVSDVHVLKGLGYGLDQQALRVVKAMPRWNPGRQSGRPVAVRYSLPIRFSLDNARLRYGGPQAMASAADTMASRPTKYYRARTFAAPIYRTKKVPKERGDFRSTIFWQGHIQLDETGKTEIEFYNSDEITSFRATVEGIGESGLVGHEELTYYTQLPFSLSAKLPVALLMGDTLALPLTLKNNTSAPLTGTWQLSLPGSWKSIKPAPGTIRLESGQARTLYVQYLVQNRPGSEVLGIAFTSEDHSDAIRQEVRTLPRGFPAHQSFSGSALTGQYALRINSPIAGTLRATLTAFPNTLSELLAGIESLLEEPHGCFEQTASSTYPNVLVLRLLKETGQGQPQVLGRAEQYIERGYKRLVSFETPEGGFDWFGKAPGNEALTAYGLLQFTQMQHVYTGAWTKRC
jgi:TonB family protein